MRGDRQNHTRSPCRPVTHLLSQNSPLSKMADYYKREAWALSTSTLISTEEAHFHGGGSFLRRKLISTEEAHFYGGSCFLWRKLISTEEGDFYGTANTFVSAPLLLPFPCPQCFLGSGSDVSCLKLAFFVPSPLLGSLHLSGNQLYSCNLFDNFID